MILKAASRERVFYEGVLALNMLASKTSTFWGTQSPLTLQSPLLSPKPTSPSPWTTGSRITWEKPAFLFRSIYIKDLSITITPTLKCLRFFLSYLQSIVSLNSFAVNKEILIFLNINRQPWRTFVGSYCALYLFFFHWQALDKIFNLFKVSLFFLLFLPGFCNCFHLSALLVLHCVDNVVVQRLT